MNVFVNRSSYTKTDTSRRENDALKRKNFQFISSPREMAGMKKKQAGIEKGMAVYTQLESDRDTSDVHLQC